MKLHYPAGQFAVVMIIFGAGPAMAQQPGVPGEPKSAKTRALEAGARVLQRNAPLQPFDVYLVGFHPMNQHG